MSQMGRKYTEHSALNGVGRWFWQGRAVSRLRLSCLHSLADFSGYITSGITSVVLPLLLHSQDGKSSWYLNCAACCHTCYCGRVGKYVIWPVHQVCRFLCKMYCNDQSCGANEKPSPDLKPWNISLVTDLCTVCLFGAIIAAATFVFNDKLITCFTNATIKTCVFTLNLMRQFPTSVKRQNFYLLHF